MGQEGGVTPGGSEDSEEGERSAAEECVYVYVVLTIVSHQCVSVCVCARLISQCFAQ